MTFCSPIQVRIIFLHFTPNSIIVFSIHNGLFLGKKVSNMKLHVKSKMMKPSTQCSHYNHKLHFYWYIAWNKHKHRVVFTLVIMGIFFHRVWSFACLWQFKSILWQVLSEETRKNYLCQPEEVHSHNSTSTGIDTDVWK